MTDLRKKLPVILILARYILPLVTGLAFTISALCYAVFAVQGGKRIGVSVMRLIGNTFSATHTYLGGTHTTQKSWFYGLLSLGAVVAVLAFLGALFFSLLAAVSAIRAFLAGEKSESANRAKLVFKMAFPNRVWLFLSNCLWLLPALYPHYFSLISRRFALATSETPLYITFNLPLVLVGIITVLTLALAVGISRAERRTKHNMFLIEHE